jgi:hypothetical protein
MYFQGLSPLVKAARSIRRPKCSMVAYAPGVRAVARKQDDLHPRMVGTRSIGVSLVQGQQFPHQWKGDAGLQEAVLARHLVVGIGRQAL